ncbi:MAG: hypothetical protein V3S26_02335, partial [Acidimicrobiia bacterium]
MFDAQDAGVGLLAGETDGNGPLFDDGFDDLVYRLTEEALAEDTEDQDTSSRQILPGLDRIPPGPYLAAIVSWVERSDLNGYHLVEV